MTEFIASYAPWIGLILGYGLLTHGILLFNDGLYWDGWLVDLWQRRRDTSSMRRFYWEVGMPNLYFEHGILGRLRGRQGIYRAISLGSILITAVFVFLTAVYAHLSDPLGATVIALLVLSYPAYALTFDGVVSLQYTFKIAIFYAACFFATVSLGHDDFPGQLAFAASLALFLVSFTANSTLVFFWGYVFFYTWLLHGKASVGSTTGEYAKIALMAALPFAFWMFKQARFPRHGYYENYNRIGLAPFTLLQVGLRAFRYGMDVPMIKPVIELATSKNATLILGSACLGLLVFHFTRGLPEMPVTTALQILAAGYGLMLLGASPFMLVGQGSWEGGWASKNFMLFHLPYALVVFAWLHLLLGSFGVILLPCVLVANAFYIIRIHLLYIAASVKDKALIRWLARNPQLGLASVIKIRDTHWIEYPFDRSSTMYWPAYLSCMIKPVWPEGRILAVLDSWNGSEGRSLTAAEIEDALEKTTVRYSFAPEVQQGPQYLVSIGSPVDRFNVPAYVRSPDARGDVHPVKQPAMVRIAAEYLWLRCVSPDRLGGFFEAHFSFGCSRLQVAAD